MNESEASLDRQKTRQKIALWTIGVSVAVIAVVAALAIGFAGDAGRPETTRLVFTSMLPLFGTWVGTVIAFYFGRENLAEATASTLSAVRLTRQVDDETPVDEVMIPAASMAVEEIGAGQTPADVSLSDIYSKMEATGYRRIPVLGPSGEVRFVVHESTLVQFAAALTIAPSDSAFTQTLDDLLQDSELRSLVEAFAVVSSNALLRDARAAMKAVANANDVFVTAAGQPSERVIGWLTNTDMAALN